jgi:RNA polymerase sigma-70 factor (ECF subfamily)
MQPDTSHDMLTATFKRERSRLVRIAAWYLPQNLAAKVSAEDVVQDAYLTALRTSERVPELEVSLFVWLRSLVRQSLIQQQRRFQTAGLRDVSREYSMEQRVPDAESSVRLLSVLCSGQSTPSTAARRNEAADQVSRALLRLSENDREILQLRFFEDLRTSEIAEILSVKPPSVSARIGRALEHLELALKRTEAETRQQS